MRVTRLKAMKSLSKLQAAFEARPVASLYEAADTSGYDGGWCVAIGAKQSEEFWFKSESAARRAFGSLKTINQTKNDLQRVMEQHKATEGGET